jgi:ribosomal protein S18 acetylase RimI-like enzyme
MGGDLPVVTLRLMTEPEFRAYRARAIDDYAAEVARNTGISDAAAREHAERTTAEELSDGVASPGQRLLIAEDADGERIGHVWLSSKPETDKCFIYDIEVEASVRGKGYGRRLLDLIDHEARAMGVSRIELNIYEDNRVARHLYETSGYREMQRQMVKQLD